MREGRRRQGKADVSLQRPQPGGRSAGGKCKGGWWWCSAPPDRAVGAHFWRLCSVPVLRHWSGQGGSGRTAGPHGLAASLLAARSRSVRLLQPECSLGSDSLLPLPPRAEAASRGALPSLPGFWNSVAQPCKQSLYQTSDYPTGAEERLSCSYKIGVFCHKGRGSVTVL